MNDNNIDEKDKNFKDLNIGASLIQSLNESLDYAKGNLTLGRSELIEVDKARQDVDWVKYNKSVDDLFIKVCNHINKETGESTIKIDGKRFHGETPRKYYGVCSNCGESFVFEDL
jgi:hypothetical protein